MSRERQVSSRIPFFGPLCSQLDAQIGWHLADDQDRMAFYDQRDEPGPLPSGEHHPYTAEVNSLQAAIDFLNELKANYNAHIADATVHQNADSDNAIAAADATNQATAITLANELRTDFNLHIAGGAGGGSHTHSVDLAFTAEALTNAIGVAAAGANLQSGAGGPTSAADVGTATAASGVAGAYHSPMADNVNAVTAAAATDADSLYTLTADLITSFRQHLFRGPLRMTEEIAQIRGDLPYDNTGEY